MSDKFTFSSAGQQHELELAMDRVGGWNNALVKELCKGNVLGLVRDVLLGVVEIKAVEHLIDCDADPLIPYDGWTVRPEDQLLSRVKGKLKLERKDADLYLGGQKIDFCLSKKQRKGSYIEGNALRKELEGEPVLNANFLDYLLAHPHLIPDALKKDENGNRLYTFFWGTIYRDSSDNLFVRYLYFLDGGWRSDCRWLEHDWYDNRPAVILAS